MHGGALGLSEMSPATCLGCTSMSGSPLVGSCPALQLPRLDFLMMEERRLQKGVGCRGWGASRPSRLASLWCLWAAPSTGSQHRPAFVEATGHIAAHWGSHRPTPPPRLPALPSSGPPRLGHQPPALASMLTRCQHLGGSQDGVSWVPAGATRAVCISQCLGWVSVSVEITSRFCNLLKQLL